MTTGERLQRPDDRLIAAIRAVVGADGVSTLSSDRAAEAGDESHNAPVAPDAVVWPAESRHVAEILRLANAHLVPVTARGFGSSMEGNPIPMFGGIALSMKRMRRIIEVFPKDQQVAVEAGMGRLDLNRELEGTGLYFVPDPGPNATVGGMIANNAAGCRAVRYGATRDNVCALEVALATGQIIHVGSRARKCSSAYNLLHLLVGSEGTLGVVTAATLKLARIPESTIVAVAHFDSSGTALEAVDAMRDAGLPLLALEYIGARTARLISEQSGLDFPPCPTLFVEVELRREAESRTMRAELESVFVTTRATDVKMSSELSKRQELWTARHEVFRSAQRSHRGASWVILDVAVPPSAYPTLVLHGEQMIDDAGVAGYTVGHAGDANLHLMLPYRDEAERTHAERLNAGLVERALELGGTSTGEHGVGMNKLQFMRAEHGPALEVMRDLKRQLDPNGILNPGKIFPSTEPSTSFGLEDRA